MNVECHSLDRVWSLTDYTVGPTELSTRFSKSDLQFKTLNCKAELTNESFGNESSYDKR